MGLGTSTRIDDVECCGSLFVSSFVFVFVVGLNPKVTTSEPHKLWTYKWRPTIFLLVALFGSLEIIKN
jgi:hypothetical protein